MALAAPLSAALAQIGPAAGPSAAQAANTEPSSTGIAPVAISTAPIKVAAVDFIPAWGDLDGNIRRFVAAVQTLAGQGVRYAVFPETALSGYDFSDPAQLAPFVDTIPGRTTAAVLPVLKRSGMYVSVGMPRRMPSPGSPTTPPC